MSTESAKAFIDRLRSDEALSETLMSAENAQDRMNAVKNAGFEFTEEDIMRSELVKFIVSKLNQL